MTDGVKIVEVLFAETFEHAGPLHPDLSESWRMLDAQSRHAIIQVWGDEVTARIQAAERRALDAPVPMRLRCPACADLHVDAGEFETRPHHTHACQSCGEVWRPAIINTVGVRFLPGFKDIDEEFT